MESQHETPEASKKVSIGVDPRMAAGIPKTALDAVNASGIGSLDRGFAEHLESASRTLADWEPADEAMLREIVHLLRSIDSRLADIQEALLPDRQAGQEADSDGGV